MFVVLHEDGANLSIHNGGVFFRGRDTQFSIALTNNTPPKSFSVDFIDFKSVFSSVFQHKTDWCSDYDINVISIIWLPLSPVEQLYSNN